jgi:hypothetical protein
MTPDQIAKSKVVSNLKDALDWVDETIETNFGGDDILWFRGHQTTEYKLIPSIHRTALRLKHEVSLSNDFILQAPSRVKDCPSQDDLCGWLTVMQHHGMPTRLLDWTRSLLIAIYFAVEPQSAVPGATSVVWAMNPYAFNIWSTRREPLDVDDPKCDYSGIIPIGKMRTIPGLSSYYDSLVQNAFLDVYPKTKKILAVAPSHIDLRRTVQHSMFTLHGSESLPIEESEYLTAIRGSMVIPPDKKELIFRTLVRLGINRAGLFPDLDNLALDLKDRVDGSHPNSDAPGFRGLRNNLECSSQTGMLPANVETPVGRLL